MADPKIRIKRSSVPAKKPTTAQIQLGELAINTFDGRVFTKKNSGQDKILIKSFQDVEDLKTEYLVTNMKTRTTVTIVSCLNQF